MDIPVLGIVENMSYVKCPDCDKQIDIFGPSQVTSLAEEYGIPAIARMPLDAEVTKLVKEGNVQAYETDALKEVFAQIQAAKSLNEHHGF